MQCKGKVWLAWTSKNQFICNSKPNESKPTAPTVRVVHSVANLYTLRDGNLKLQSRWCRLILIQYNSIHKLLS